MSDNYRNDIISIDFIRNVLKASDQEAESIADLVSKNATIKGENFLGDLASVEFKAEGKIFHWMVKMLKKDAVASGFNLARILGVFDTEVAIYKTLIPALNSVHPDVKLGTTVPLIGANVEKGQEALILQHMKQFNWQDIVNKKQGLNLDHVSNIMKWLAKLHGLSYVLIETNPNWIQKNPIFMPLSQRLDPSLKAMMKNTRKNVAPRFIKTAQLLDDEKDPKYSKWMENAFKNGLDLDDCREKMQRLDKSRFNAINHLDPWFNNILVKYAANGDIEDLLMLDFQGSGYCNVGNDLALFILSSTTRDFRQKFLSKALETYHETLINVVKTASSGTLDPDYSLEQVKQDYEKALAYGLVFCFQALPMILSEPEDDIIEFATLDFTDKEAMKSFEEKAERQYEAILTRNHNVRQRMQGLLDDLMEANIF